MSVFGRVTRRIREDTSLQGTTLIAPGLLWMVGFLIVPLLLIVVLSLAWRGAYGPVDWGTTTREFLGRLSLDNYARLADPLYLGVLWTSLQMAALTTAICLVVGYPVAYFLARSGSRWRSLLLFLLLVPFWTNFLIRIYAWMLLLRTEGLVNRTLVAIGLIPEPLQIMYSPTAVMIAMVYEFLPFMVLPLFTSLEKLDPALLEAASDLYARPVRTFLRVTLPLSLPGVIAGTILVFIPTMGMFVVPDLMGGARTALVGNLVQRQFLAARDWPFGAAASMVLMALTLVATLLYTRVSGFGEELVA
ncbi:MAG TPA: ABC transporter permease [Anaerolineales bacterium]|nr:ABC transporter permease [Anaerolineales bacterium]